MPAPEVQVGFVLDVLLEKIDLEAFDPVGQDRHPVLPDIEQEEGEQVGGHEERSEEDPLHRRRQYEIARGYDEADPAGALDDLGEEHEGFARAHGGGDGDGLVVRAGGPELGDPRRKDRSVGFGHAKEEAAISRGDGYLVDRREVLPREKRDQSVQRDLEYRGAPIDSVTVGERQRVEEPAGGRVDSNDALRSFGGGHGIVGRVAGLAVVAVDRLELGLGADVAWDAAEVEALSVRVYQADARQAGGLFLELPEEVGPIEGVLRAEIGQEAPSHRVLGEDGAEAREVGGVETGLRFRDLGERGTYAPDHGRIAEARLDYVEESREGRHGEGREEEHGNKEAYARFLAYRHLPFAFAPFINISNGPSIEYRFRKGHSIT